MASRFILPFADVGSGIKPSSGARLFFYETGTNTFKDTFTDQAATTPNANPVIADSNGVFSNIFINGTYKVVLQDANSSQIWEADPVVSLVSVSNEINILDNTSLIAASGLDIGVKLLCPRYYAGGDLVDGLFYVIVAGGTGTANNGSFFDIDNGNQARLILPISINVDTFGAVGDGIADDIIPINTCLANYNSVVGSTNKSYKITSSINFKTFNDFDLKNSNIVSDASAGFTYFNYDNCLYSIVKNARLILQANCTGIVIQSTDAGSSSSQFNKIYNVDVEAALFAITKGIEIIKGWSNQFYSCNFLRASTGAIFGVEGEDQSCNANHFYGCEVRSVNTESGSVGVIHNSGDNNAWIGGIIENIETLGIVKGGSFLINSAYLEGSSAARAFLQEGGQFTLTDNFNNFAVDISGGFSFRLSGQHFIKSTLEDPTPTYTANFPAIRTIGDIATRIDVNIDVDPEFVYVIRENEYWTGSAWAKKTVASDKVDWIKPKFSVRLATDRTGVTGDGTVYTVNFGNNKEFVKPSTVLDNSGVFTAPINGFYHLSCQVLLSGQLDGSNSYVKIVTSNREYYCTLSGIGTGTNVSDGTQVFSGSAFVEMERGDTAVVKTRISGQGAGTVSVLRINAADAYTAFSGYKVN